MAAHVELHFAFDFVRHDGHEAHARPRTVLMCLVSMSLVKVKS
jgi:hypothetical protein